MGPGWFLDKVTVLSVESGLEQIFPCAQWLALDEADGLIERTLLPDSKNETTLRKKTSYEIEVGTIFIHGFVSPPPGNGTDAE